MAINPGIYWQYYNAMPKNEKMQMLGSFNNQYDRVRQQQMQENALKRQAELDAMRKEQFDLEMGQARQAIGEKNALNSYVNDVMRYGNEQPNTVGPQMGGVLPPTNREEAMRFAGESGLGMAGFSAADKMFPKTEPVDQYEGLESGYETFLRANRIPNSPQAYSAWQENVTKQKEAGAPKTNIGVSLSDSQKLGMKPFVDSLPKLYEQAESDRSAIDRINNQLSILRKQGNKVTGLSGDFRRSIAPIATALGVDTEDMSDAQLVKTLFDVGAGSMRMEVVGPGPVSEFEQRILQAVSGGKMAAADAAIRLLEYNKRQKTKGISSFNKRLGSASNMEGFGYLGDLYPQVDLSKPKVNYSEMTDEELLNAPF